MNESSITSKIISGNDIKQFILRIDFLGKLPVERLVASLKNKFTRVEERKLMGFEVAIDLPNSSSELSKKDFIDTVLVKEPNLTLTLSPKDNSLGILSTAYLDNSTYKDLSNKIIEICKDIEDCKAKRIGLRYINDIPCLRLSHISHIFQKKFASIIKNMISTDDTSRAIAVQIRNCGDTSLKVQYGLPNKYFPAKITNYDLLLDIDSFTVVTTPICEWEDIIRDLNHSAYSAFVSMINESYIESKKNV